MFSITHLILLLSCVSGTSTVSVLDVQRFIKVKTSTSVSPISFGILIIVVSKLKGYHVVEV